MTPMETTDLKDAQQIAREFMFGELLQAATKHLRTLGTPWLRLPKAEQERILRNVQDDIAGAVEHAVVVIASDDRTKFVATVESVTFKDGVKAVLQMGNTHASHELADTAQGRVIVVIEDPRRYTENDPENAPKSDSDQPNIPGV